MSAAEEIDRHFRTYPKRSYEKGQILIYAGEEPKGIFYVTKGRVSQYDVSYRGDELVVNSFKHPAFFPMSWAITKTPNRYFYKTETSTDVHVVPVRDALEFITSDKDLLLDLLQRLYKGTDGLLGRMVQLMAGSAQDRVLYELLVEAYRFGVKQPDGSVLLQVTETDLAAHAGLSRETVSRVIHKLKEMGHLRSDGRSIVVNELPPIEAMLRG